MPSFQYQAVTAAGEKVAGVLAGASEQAVLTELETRRLVPVVLREQESSGPLFGRRLASTRQLATAYGQLADLLRAGVPLMRGLRLLGSQKAVPRLAKVFGDVADAVSQGGDLADAMSARPEVFAPVHVAMVRAGERGGFLEGVFARLAELLTAQADMRSKVVGSLVYPAVLMGAGLLIMALIFGVFIPKFRPMFERMELGTLTKLVLGMGDLAAGYGLLFLGAAAVLGVWVWRMLRRPSVRSRVAELKLKVPVIGPLVRSLAVARFCRILGTMLSNAIPMLAAMQIAKDAAGSPPLERAIAEASESVRQGEALAPPLAKSGLFPEDIIEMIAVGESANNLDAVLLTIAETAEKRVDRLMSGAVKLIEPGMIIILAVAIGLVAWALISPIVNMSKDFG
ncbi:MAG: type II secretion system F family protein [Phycisphaerales bacterium]|nr:type II secretion system F family protein [Phycisphaerales bacterium]